jgi:tetratricopeptide (TPR) repeat protein
LKRIPAKWKSETAVREGLAKVFGDVDMFEEAIAAYAGALAGDDSKSSLKAGEQLANLRAKQAVQAWRNGPRDAAATEKAVAAIRQSIEQIEAVSNLVRASTGTTAPSRAVVERLSLLGSAWKRMAIVKRDDERRQALIESAAKYKEAYERSRRIPNREPDHYPAVNWQLMRALLGQRVDRKLLKEVDKYAAGEDARSPNFWALVNAMDAQVVEALAEGKVGERSDKIETAFKRAWKRGGNYREGRAIKEQLEFIRDMLPERGRKRANLVKDFDALLATVDGILNKAD